MVGFVDHTGDATRAWSRFSTGTRGKEQENLRKHGVSFSAAQVAFFDPGRVIAHDVGHSAIERRFYCIGRTDLGVLTVRFTYRGSVIRIFGAGYWRKGKQLYEAQSKIHR